MARRLGVACDDCNRHVLVGRIYFWRSGIPLSFESDHHPICSLRSICFYFMELGSSLMVFFSGKPDVDFFQFILSDLKNDYSLLLPDHDNTKKVTHSNTPCVARLSPSEFHTIQNDAGKRQMG